MPDIAFNQIVKQYGAVTVLKDLDLAVHEGEFLVLLGPSGCGKTTLLNLLAGLLDVTSGEIKIGDRDVTELDPKDRGLAMVFQSYALDPTKTVRGNLKFGMVSQKLPRDEVERRIDWAAKMLRIEPLLDRKPSQLSCGQRQRVAIGRALVKKVGVFLFDEPLSNLDAKLRTEMRLEIKKLHAELKQTVVYVTHDQIEAMTMATRIAIMDRGVIQQIGSPDEVYESPANLFVAKFIGAPPMNVLDVKLKVEGNSVTAVLEPTGTPMDLSDYAFASRPQDGMGAAVGLRPENFTIGDGNGSRPAAVFNLPLLYTEKTGSDATAFLTSKDDLLAARIEPSLVSKLTLGAPLRLSFPREKLNVFDARTGLRM
ncbi:MAG: ABC transporter ATP-binding protein [Devosia sp.]